MLLELHLKNFRGFDDHTIPFHDFSVVVGVNNAGKSTIVEALRFVSIVTSRYRGLNFVKPPEAFDTYGALTGVSPSLKNLDVNLEHVFHRYGNAPAIITAKFRDQSMVQVFIGEDKELFACLYDQNKRLIKSKEATRSISIPSIAIMPQIGPLRREEQELDTRYVKDLASFGISSLHFRNHFLVFPELWREVQVAIEQTWPGVSLQEIIFEGGFKPRKIHLEVRNDDFVAEIGLMGHGLQMWLQTLAFLCRSSGSATVILDEPDVYMHADMQRRLVRYLRGRFAQTILTTHSVEIMSEVEPSDILVVDRRYAHSNYSINAPAVQQVVDRIGSVHNMHLVRLTRSKRLILVEGKDIKVLKIIQNLIYPKSDFPIDVVPNMSIGGWGGWNYAVGSSMLITNAVGEKIVTYCILDRDYHSNSDIDARYIEASKKGVKLHIWSKKEIENFAVDAALICSYILSKVIAGNLLPSKADVNSKIIEFAEDERDNVFDALSSEYLKCDRAGGISQANKRAREVIADCYERSGSICDLASGKHLISRLSAWSQSAFGVSFGSNSLFRYMTASNLPDELRSVVKAIELVKDFGRS